MATLDRYARAYLVDLQPVSDELGGDGRLDDEADKDDEVVHVVALHRDAGFRVLADADVVIHRLLSWSQFNESVSDIIYRQNFIWVEKW
jgi:hypothetical protein